MTAKAPDDGTTLDGGAQRIVVALDVPDLDRAVDLAQRLVGHVGWFKVGLELFAAHGPRAVERVRAFGPVFLDLKLHDIPTTVERAAARVAELGVGLLTVHATGGPTMLEAAVRGLGAGGRVLAVTLLTSLDDDELARVGLPSAATGVPALAALAVSAGVPGLVCAPADLVAVRRAVGSGALVVTPGVRAARDGVDDHARSTSPGRALRDGADLVVIGRPITSAPDPVAAARLYASELGAP